MTSPGPKKRTMLGIGKPRPFAPFTVEPADATLEEPPSAYDGWIGRVIDDRYEIQELLAEGGMGAVFVAKHTKLGRRVAIKLIHQEHEGNTEVVQRFAREVEVTARLQHRHIVSALDCGTMADGAVYLVMELVTGRSLAEAIVDDGGFDWRRAADVGAQIADALWAAHRAGVVHRDLKPDNVLLEPDDEGGETVRLLDFGIAYVAPESGAAPAEPLTRVGTVLGTVGYMAPEQCLGQPVDGRSDLYTLGVLLWEMLAGRSLFDDTLTLTSFITTQLAEARPPIAGVARDVPPALADVIGRLLAPKRADRPEDAQRVRDELRELMAVASEESIVMDADSEPPSARPPSASQPSTPQPSAPQPTTPQSSDAKAPVPSGATRPAPLASVVSAARALPREARLVIALTAAGSALAGIVLVIVLAVSASSDPVVKAEGAPVAAEAAEPEVAPEGTSHDALSAPQAILLSADADWRARHDAARAIVRHEPRDEVPPLFLALAQLETVSDCRVRLGAVERLAELEDDRALAPLRRHARARRPRCGRRFRTEVDRATARIRRANREVPASEGE